MVRYMKGPPCVGLFGTACSRLTVHRSRCPQNKSYAPKPEALNPQQTQRSTYKILYYSILYYTILFYTLLFYTILYYAKLYYTILYYTVLYHTTQEKTLESPYMRSPCSPGSQSLFLLAASRPTACTLSREASIGPRTI